MTMIYSPTVASSGIFLSNRLQDYMTYTIPYGNTRTASIIIIGHDPRLQNSQAEAEQVFFMEYLEKYSESNLPRSLSEVKKYELAHAVLNYLESLARRHISLDEIYVTNLCNEFLPHVRGSGTVLIPDEKAQAGVRAICDAIEQGCFKIILPMACQTFYHLCRLGFIEEENGVQEFLLAARPDPEKARQGLYEQSKTGAFLSVCGKRYHHSGIPVIPILHVKMWPLGIKMARYYREPMQQASRTISSLLRPPADQQSV
jgi:hypothetical protein